MLTKSDFKLFMECPRHCWVKKQREGDYHEIFSPQDQFTTKQGYDVEKLAKTLFPGGVYIPVTGETGYEQTKEAIASGATVIYQATIVTGELQARADILVKNGTSWDLYEVKAKNHIRKDSKQAPLEDELLQDIGFQYAVFRNADIPLKNLHFMFLNKQFVRNGDIDVKQLLQTENVTKDVQENITDIDAAITDALRAMQLDSCETLEACFDPFKCPCPDYCHLNIPSYHIYTIPRFSQSKKKIAQLRAANVFDILELPADYELTEKQQRYVDTVRAQKPHIDHAGIQSLLASLTYPLHFLDYETCPVAIPPIDGYRPYQQITFQYSLDIIDAPDAAPRHYEYLARSFDETGRPLITRLKEDIGTDGSVIVWHESFEQGRIDDMASLFPDYAEYLHALNARIFDLKNVVADGLYIDPRFKGKASIKWVLPVIAPDLSYKNLGIQDGGMAYTKWHEAVNGDGLNAAEKDKIFADLLEYCGLDTYAMVTIWNYMTKLK